MIFRGTLRFISYVNGMDIFLSAHKILLKDIGGFVQRQSARLRQTAEAHARRHGRTYLHVASSERRENAFVQIADFSKAQQMADAAVTRN
jgi:hypothetical protein